MLGAALTVRIVRRVRVATIRRQVALPSDEVMRRLANGIAEPRAFLGGLGQYRGRVSGSSFWFCTNAGPRADWAMTLRGEVRRVPSGSEIEATITTPPFGRSTLLLTVGVVVLAILHAPDGVVGPVVLIWFLSAFAALLDVIWHWRRPGSLLTDHLDRCLGPGS